MKGLRSLRFIIIIFILLHSFSIITKPSIGLGENSKEEKHQTLFEDQMAILTMYEAKEPEETRAIDEWPQVQTDPQRTGYSPKVMGVYRVHSRGVYSGQNQITILSNTIKTYGKINAHLNYEYESITRDMISVLWYRWTVVFARLLIEGGSVQETINTALEVLDDWPIELPLSNKQKAKMLGRVYADLGFTS
jgi:hypothetical protein